ncbi:enoyl-CoA hydratase/isomerase family protein [Purpureocillium lavendulum]|uniref:Enoyl-CoA hydratase/isomerase family protein n=1 Tax=Purpureocillium lavendulum TaxID=1247861 RepID=A0AB34FD82_9HYPO|nr:enoyl-CoA hydratase/isomerase family protein [Purpureocillium lavendulum]
MSYSQFSCFDVETSDGVARVTLNHPPLNLIDEVMAPQFQALAAQLENDQSVRVIILQSKLPNFFIAHSGLSRVTAGPRTVSQTRSFRQTQIIGETFRNMGKVTIAKVEGRCRGGGNEIAMAADMCFAALGKAFFGQPEVGLGLVPGGGATQRLPRLMGRARALEVLLTGRDFSAADAERMGFINRALPPDELDAFVDELAKEISQLPTQSISHIKKSVDQGAFSSISEGLLVEAHNSDECAATDNTRDLVRRGLEEGLETVKGELDMPAIVARLNKN